MERGPSEKKFIIPISSQMAFFIYLSPFIKYFLCKP